MREVANTSCTDTDVGHMLEEIRTNHIDINAVIREELEQLLPEFIADIVRGVYQELMARGIR